MGKNKIVLKFEFLIYYVFKVTSTYCIRIVCVFIIRLYIRHIIACIELSGLQQISN